MRRRDRHGSSSFLPCTTGVFCHCGSEGGSFCVQAKRTPDRRAVLGSLFSVGVQLLITHVAGGHDDHLGLRADLGDDFHQFQAVAIPEMDVKQTEIDHRGC